MTDDKLRATLEAELELLPPEDKMSQFEMGAAAAYNYALSLLAASATDEEPAAMLQWTLAALGDHYIVGTEEGPGELFCPARPAVPALDVDGFRVFGLTVEEVRTAIATADIYAPQWRAALQEQDR